MLIPCVGAGLFRFNPRARVGRDTVEWLFKLPPSCFNPRARVGRDPGY